MDHQTCIQRFYKDKVVLLTGGTGFLGKILIEKLLHSCPDIRHLYLLIREKKGLTVEDRLNNLLNDSVFFRLKKERPQFPEKLSVIQGDLHKPNLGLAQSDVTSLIQNVDMVVHAAATIKFNERLKLAIETNVEATKQLCCMAQNIVNLKAFVYVSTAFSNCEKDLIPEKVCPPPMCPENLLSLAKVLDEDQLDNITCSLIHPKINTYIFSKCAAENIVLKCKGSLPIAILRPSMVVPAAEEPAPGWIDNLNGSMGSVAATSAGLMHTMMVGSDLQANMVPVDKVANGIIALGFAVASQNWQCTKDEVPIINFVAKSYNCITWGEFCKHALFFIRENPSQSLLWYPFCTNPQNRWVFCLHKLLLHNLPATTIDFLTAKCGYPTKLRKFYHAIDKYVDVIDYFCNHEFNFEENNSDLLWNLLEPQDQQIFPFNMADINWIEYIRTYVLGCRRYLLKEDDSTLEKSRLRVKLLYFIHLVTKWACFFGALGVSWIFLKLFLRKIIGNGL